MPTLPVSEYLFEEKSDIQGRKTKTLKVLHTPPAKPQYFIRSVTFSWVFGKTFCENSPAQSLNTWDV